MMDRLAQMLSAPLYSWLGVLIVSTLVVVVVASGHWLGARVVKRIARPYPYLSVIVRYIDTSSLVVLVCLALDLLWWQMPDLPRYTGALRTGAALGLIVALTWLAVRLAAAVGDAIMQAHPLEAADNLQARRIHTQARVLVRIVMVVIMILGAGAALMMFPGVRHLGASLLASAGMAGLVAGIAARPVLGNLIAGLQIALSQPIRLDDVVVIQGECGRVEEITGTYVAVRLWDQRRLVVPLQWFIENPFANWTRNSSEIVGAVLLYVDYQLPLAPLRNELTRLLAEAPEWDGRTQVLQVTDVTERTMQLRVLVSAANSSLCGDLRCRVREGLIGFIQQHYMHCLPRTRAEWVSGPSAGQDPPAVLPAGTHALAPSTVAQTAADPVSANHYAVVR